MKDTTSTTINAERNKGSILIRIGADVLKYAAILLMAVNLIATVVLYESYKHHEQTVDLKRYDLDFFKENDWATLKAQVEAQNALIQAYGLQKAVKDAAKEK